MKRKWIAGALATAALATTGTVAMAANANAETEETTPKAGYCMQVKAQDINVYKTPGGSGTWGTWTRGYRFQVYSYFEEYNRFRTNVFLEDAYVTADARWVEPCVV